MYISKRGTSPNSEGRAVCGCCSLPIWNEVHPKKQMRLFYPPKAILEWLLPAVEQNTQVQPLQGKLQDKKGPFSAQSSHVPRRTGMTEPGAGANKFLYCNKPFFFIEKRKIERYTVEHRSNSCRNPAGYNSHSELFSLA